jgi:hypothetical protein
MILDHSCVYDVPDAGASGFDLALVVVVLVVFAVVLVVLGHLAVQC